MTLRWFRAGFKVTTSGRLGKRVARYGLAARFLAQARGSDPWDFDVQKKIRPV